MLSELTNQASPFRTVSLAVQPSTLKDKERIGIKDSKEVEEVVVVALILVPSLAW